LSYHQHICYRMRTHITKSLTTRCMAIQNVAKIYNKAALEMIPPRPTLNWTKASHYSFLEDFKLLHDTQQDIRARPWVEPVVHATMKAQRIKHAQEEIYNCNIEVRHLHTHLLDENWGLENSVKAFNAQSHPAAGAISEFAHRCRHINLAILSRVHDILNLKAFTGETTLGVRIG
jgi:hypothetical protein